MAAIGASLAGLAAAIGLLVASRWFRRNGGLLVVAALAVLASSLPYVLFNWTTARDGWAWPWLVHESGLIGWLRFDSRPRSDGIAVQAVLALVVAAASAAQLALWSIGRKRSRPPSAHRAEPAA